MTKYQLTQWEAIELFCKIVSKYEGIDIEKFRRNDQLVLSLVKYSSDRLSIEFAKTNLQPIAQMVGQDNYYPKALYDLSQEIRFSEPVVRSASRLLLLLKYIEEEYTLMQYQPLGSLWNPNDKQRMFEDSTWALYYYEEYLDSSIKKIQTGVTRAIVKLLPFAKLIIKDIDASKGEPGKEEEFKGKYSIYGGSVGQHLLLEGRLGDAQEKNLHILLYIGTGRFEVSEIALGQYHDVGQSIYSGTVIMEKIDPEAKDLVPKFFKKDDVGVEPVIWDYFRDKYQNRLRTKIGITRKESLQHWIDSKKSD
jgi:hypothetical protein